MGDYHRLSYIIPDYSQQLLALNLTVFFLMAVGIISAYNQSRLLLSRV